MYTCTRPDGLTTGTLTGWDLVGRRNHAWRQDAFAGQSSLWLSLLAAALLVGDELWALVVLVGVVAAATVAAVALTCKGGARRQWGLIVAAGVGAALWFVPGLWPVWASSTPLPRQVAATLVLMAGMAVPGVALAFGLGWAALEARYSSVNMSVPVIVVPACAVVVAVVMSGILGRAKKNTAALDRP